MTTVREPGAAPPARTVTPDMVTMDVSRYHSEVHGDRVPEDPMYLVKYFQDDLPFDIHGKLVPDDGSNQPFSLMIEGKPTQVHPLWNPKRRDLLKRKMERIARHLPVDEETDPAAAAKAAREEEQADIDEVRLPDWLRGTADYRFDLVREAVAKRYNRKFQSIEDVVKFLGGEEIELVPYAEVATRYRKYLKQPD